ncbi:TetR/AcrR family transcriptional regulator [Mucilaginibacter sp. SG564]|uniref:TetR/AcrR family transcriptional regulator n=1 Tax=Mucilaginibacter sp. SG564 TaxID=2587022 RepID=UPI001557AF32|nr:TetR/AcrR family transcriptional regulator [Mucilaginibacter sp. SG564]NOW96043.1 AcrR family transcriptional regulator [Mucilaginibacter sp. SG564]
MGKAERTKQFIIEEAAPIFNTKGIMGTTVDDVIKAAKVARGCLYNHFNTKDALIYETVDYLLKEAVEKVLYAVNKKKSARDRIFAYLDYNKDVLETYSGGGCPILNMAVDSDDINPVVKQKVKKVISLEKKMLMSIFEMGIINGEFSSDLNPEEFAYKIFASIQGGIAICRVLNSNKPMSFIIKSLKADILTFKINRIS